MSKLPKAIDRFTIVPITIQMTFFLEIKKKNPSKTQMEINRTSDNYNNLGKIKI